MLKWLNSPKGIFTALQVASVLAIVVGVWLSVGCGVAPMWHTAPLHAAIALVNCGLWAWAWVCFMGMCARLKKESAFTEKNRRALLVIGMCVAGIALLMCLRALPQLLRQPDLFLIIEAVVLPGVFLTVSGVALILSSLLRRAMALEEAQEYVI